MIGRQEDNGWRLVQASDIPHPACHQLRQTPKYARRFIEQYIITAQGVNLVVELIIPINDQAGLRAYLQTLAVLPACRDLHLIFAQVVSLA